MNQLMLPVNTLLSTFGINPKKTVKSIRGLPLYFSDLIKLKASKASSKNRKLFPFGKPYPCLEDRFTQSGNAKGHYFHQDLVVARRIFVNVPKLHVDIGSRLDGFVAHVAAYRLIEIIDIRPLSSTIPNIKFIQADLMENIDERLIDYCDSLSCLHALEHFGLGRYGDSVDYDGYLDGFENMSKILQTGGRFYFSVPIGPQRIEFNAHRVFSVDYLMELFNGKYRIDKFSFVDDKGDLHEDVDINSQKVRTNFGCNYGCGIFEMIKI